MNKFEDLFKTTTIYESLSKDPVHGSTLMLRHEEANGASYYLNPFTRLANEMFVMGYEHAKAEANALQSLDSGMNAFGKPVPQHRINQAQDFLVEVWGGRKSGLEIAMHLNNAVRAVERDRPKHLFEDMGKHLDQTGIYRLLSLLTTGEAPQEPFSTLDYVTAETLVESSYSNLQKSPRTKTGKYVEMRPPFYFSQLRKGMIVVFKSGHTSFIRDLVEPDDQGQSFFGMALEKSFDAPHDLVDGYLYSYGTRDLCQGTCDNTSDLDIDHIAIKEKDVKASLNLELEVDRDCFDQGEPPENAQQAYLYFAQQLRLEEGKTLHYCRVQFHKALKRESILLQGDNLGEVLDQLETHLPKFLGLTKVKIYAHIDTLRADAHEYSDSLQDTLGRLFLNQPE